MFKPSKNLHQYFEKLQSIHTTLNINDPATVIITYLDMHTLQIILQIQVPLSCNFLL